METNDTGIVVAVRGSIVVELQPGTVYLWCRCGRSKEQPFCDGSHEGTGIEPLEFSVDETRRYPLCQCKHSANPPFCDAAHRKLPMR